MKKFWISTAVVTNSAVMHYDIVPSTFSGAGVSHRVGNIALCVRRRPVWSDWVFVHATSRTDHYVRTNFCICCRTIGVQVQSETEAKTHINKNTCKHTDSNAQLHFKSNWFEAIHGCHFPGRKVSQISPQKCSLHFPSEPRLKKPKSR